MLPIHDHHEETTQLRIKKFVFNIDSPHHFLATGSNFLIKSHFVINTKPDIPSNL